MTQTLASSYKDLGRVWLPEWQCRQFYMAEFDTTDPSMPEGFEDYTATVEDLCFRAGHRGRAFVTVDEKDVAAGMSQRRPGAHVDGKFTKDQQIWGHPDPVWAHYCNRLPVERMSVIVASDVAGCTAYPGVFSGSPSETGDCEHMRSQFSEAVPLEPHCGYVLSPDCVHESKVFDTETRRTFLRIALENI